MLMRTFVPIVHILWRVMLVFEFWRLAQVLGQIDPPRNSGDFGGNSKWWLLYSRIVLITLGFMIRY